MQIDEYLRSASGDLLRHKMRTLLTMLGIIFGVGAVISMLSIGAGAQAEALELIDSMGLRNIIVRDKPVDDEDLYTLREKSLGLSLRDLDALREVSPDFITAGAGKRVRSNQILSESGRSSGQVMGVTRTHFALYNLALKRGSYFDRREEESFARVCLLGSRASRDLFAYLDPVGRAVKVNDVWFTVVGVLRDQNLGKDSFEGVELESADNSIFIPITTALKMFDYQNLASEVDEMVLQVAPGASIETNAILLTSVLQDLHGGEMDFSLVVPEKLLEQSSKTRQIFNVVMGWHRRHLPARRRHRHHEHHAGHACSSAPARSASAAPSVHAARDILDPVPGRGRRHQPDSAALAGVAMLELQYCRWSCLPVGLEHGGHRLLHHPGVWLFAAGGNGVRYVPGTQCRQAQPHRRAALRVKRQACSRSMAPAMPPAAQMLISPRRAPRRAIS